MAEVRDKATDVIKFVYDDYVIHESKENLCQSNVDDVRR